MILVTGATGMVGSYTLLQLAQQGKRTVALYRSEEKIENTKNLFDKNSCAELFQSIIWKKADILDIPSLELVFEGIETVIHCAAVISFFPKDKKILYKTNVEGTANMVNFSLHYKVNKFIYVSSVAALGSEIDKSLFITEESLWNNEIPHSDYAISKKKAELEVYRGQQEGLEVAILNPGVIFGKHFPNNESVFFEKLVSNRFVPYTPCVISAVSVVDVANAIVFCLTHQLDKQFILVAANLPMKALLYLFEPKNNSNKKYIKIKKWQFRIVQFFDFLLGLLPFVDRKLSNTTVRSAYNNRKFDGRKITTHGFIYQDFEQTIK